MALLLLLCGAADAEQQTISLRIAALPEGRHVYYVKLLEESLRAAGYKPDLVLVRNAPQPRLWDMVANNQLSLIWGVQTSARDKSFASVANQLTNGLIGQRILLVKKGQEDAYAGVASLEDFRRLGKVGGAGADWYELEVWKFNALPVYAKTGDWRQLLPMVASGSRGIDYVVRSTSEIVGEAADFKDLAIERHLILTHDRDMRLYLSPEATRYKSIIESALAQADRSGLKARLIAQYLTPDLKALNLGGRVTLKLATPVP